MGSGLIWAGLGKGISDAGSTYGNAMFKAVESEMADQRAMQRAEALERLKDQMAEERAKRDADIYSKAQTKATQLGVQRKEQELTSDAGKLATNAQTIAGDAPAMSQDEMRSHLESLNPSERKALEGTGLISRAASPLRQEMQGYDDTISEARKLGGSSTLVKSLQDAKKERLAEIKAEFKEEGEKEERKQNARRLDLMEERIASQNKTDQQKADAATTNANKPRGGSSGGDGAAKVRSTYTDGDGNRVAVMSDGSTKVLGTSGEFNKSVANLIKDKEKNDFTFKNKTDAEKKEWATNMLASGSKRGDNTGTRPPLDSFKR